MLKKTFSRCHRCGQPAQTIAKLKLSAIILAMEEEQKGEVFQPQKEYESRINRQRSNPNIKRYFTIILLIIILGILIFGATRFLGGERAEPTPTETKTPTPAETQTPTPTKKPVDTPTPKPTINPIDKTTGLDRSKLSIHVLNGSGVAGAGVKAADYLESLGYNVIQVGNAENFNFDKTTIQIKSAKENYLNLLNSDLAKSYSIGTASAGLASGNADAIVTVGRE
jgi:hypothetical protein